MLTTAKRITKNAQLLWYQCQPGLNRPAITINVLGQQVKVYTAHSTCLKNKHIIYIPGQFFFTGKKLWPLKLFGIHEPDENLRKVSF
jgi:hypothetical protein